MSDLTPADELLETARHSRARLPGELEEDEEQIIVFRAAGRSYALPIWAVERTERVSTVTPVPRAPQFVRGVSNLRGGVICVLELALLLGQDAGSSEETRSLLILNEGGRRLAIQSSSLPDFLRVSRSKVLPTPSTEEEDIYAGAVEHETGLLGLIDPAKLFDLIERCLSNGG